MYSQEQMQNGASSTSPDQPRLGVDRVPRLESAEFAARYFRPRQPVVITDMATQWPACQRWSFDFFAQLDPDRAVTLEKGNVLQDETAFESARMADYLTGLTQAGHAVSGAEDEGTAKRYLSMLRIFEQFPQLRADVDFSLLEAMTLKQVYFAWLGPAGTLTGYHIDWIDNILAQISGRKRVWLVPPSASPAMYPSSKYDYRSTLSEVEPNTWDAKRHPLFATVRPVEITLEPGQMLFIPRGWWHRVMSLTPSISINAFGHDLSGLLLHQSRASLLHGLHQLGLYGREDCTCHKKTADSKRAK
ncbi:MAG: cupin-like domain-containing protein [Thiothrix litoralis]